MTTSNRSFDPLRSGRAGNYVLGDTKRHSVTNGNNNDSGSDLGEEELDCNDNDRKPSRKPSYLGLSCAVSGYSNYSRYRSPLRKTSSSPTQIHVGSEPQTLDAGRNNQVVVGMRNGHKTSPPIRGQQMITDDRFFSSRKFFSTPGAAGDNHSNNSAREGSPGSDCSGSSSIGSSGSGGGGGGSLVQKQIERLYGGRVVPVRVTSPEPKSPEDLSFGKESSSGSSNPLDFKSLKAPAVFRLLRPEFREQLKNNSCRVFIPTDHSSIGTLSTPVTSSCYRVTTANYEQRREKKNLPLLQRFQSNPSSDRVIPIKMSCERVIPIVAEKPALPAKPSGSKENASSATHVVTSPALVANCMKAKTSHKVVEKTPPVAHEEVAEELDEGDFSQQHPVGGGGTRERSLLCPIQEEESDSTASTNSFSVGNRCNGVSKITSLSKSNGKSSGPVAAAVPAGQVQDGNYFIKVLENEIFKFEEQICDFEEDLSTPDSNIPVDIRDSILAAVGKGRLLKSQKLVQFRGLCDKNINSNHADDPFVPTCGDLAGFWDMVYIQVEHVHSLFAELATLRKNGWVQSKKALNDGSSVNGLSNAKSGCSKKRVVKTSKANSEAQSKQKSEATKARDEARKKMLEERRMLMKRRNAASNEGVELFVAVK